MNMQRYMTHISRVTAISFILLTLFFILPNIAMAGKVLPDDLLITNDAAGTPHDQTSPAVAYDCTNNDYLVVWTDYRNIGTPLCGTEIYGKICTGAGVAMNCGNEFVISDATGNQAQPKVAFSCKNSTYLVVWTDSRNGSYGRIYGQLVGPAGTLLNTTSAVNFPISTHTPTVDVNQYDPDVIDNPVANKFVVAWVDTSTFDTTNSFTYQGYALGYGNCPTTSPTYPYLSLPYVDHNLIRTAEVDAAGVVGTPNNISQFASISPLSDSGAGLLAATVSQSWSVYKYEAKPKLSYSAMTGENFVAFSGRNYTVTLAAGYDTIVTTNGAIPPVYTITCTYRTPTITATDNDAGVTQIKIRKNDGLGLLQDMSLGFFYQAGPPIVKLSAIAPTVAVDPNTNRMFVAWEEPSLITLNAPISYHQIYGQLIDLDSFLPYGFPISISAGTGARTSPVAAFDNVNQRFFVAWEDARNQSANISNMDIYGQFIDPQGNLSGANSLVSMAVDNQLAPAIAFGDVNFRDFFVVFKDARSPGNSDIYGQLFEFSEMPQLLISDAAGAPILNGTIDFGNVAVGQTKDINFKLCNNGNKQLTVNSLSTPGAPFYFLTPWPVTISPAICYDMTLHFAPTAAGSYSGNLTNTFGTIIDSDGGKVIIYFSGAGVGILPLSITTTSLPDGIPATVYTTTTLVAYGGVFPYTSWAVSSGSLPPGLNLAAATGIISGTPTTPGVYTFTIKVTDSNSPTPIASTRDFTINVGVVTITTTSLKAWTQGVEYGNAPAVTLTNTGGTAPHTWAKTAGTLPAGITLNATGTITGIPTESGVFTFTAKVTDSLTSSATKDLSLTINPPPFVVTSSLLSGIVGTAYSQTLSATGSTLPLTWAITAGSLPTGLSFNTGTGVISGTPSAPGTYSFTTQVTDAVGAWATSNLSITVSDSGVTVGTLTPSPASLDFGTVKSGTKSTAQTVTITNTGTASLTLTTVTKPGAPFNVSANTCSSGKVLAVSASCMIKFIFNPTAAGTFTKNLTIISNDPASPSLNVSLSGIGSSITTGSSKQLVGTPAAVDFGQVKTSSKSETQTLTVSNAGGGKIKITSVKNPGVPFKLASNACSGKTLATGASCTVKVSFNPTKKGSFKKDIIISSNDPNTPTLKLPLTGNAK